MEIKPTKRAVKKMPKMLESYRRIVVTVADKVRRQLMR